MKSRANGWLRRWLIKPLAFCFSHKAPKAQPAFSVPDVLKAPRKILIVPDGRAGGLFLGAPQFQAIRHRYAEARITLLVHAHKAYIAREIPFVDEVMVYEDFLLPLGGKLRGLVRRLQEQAFDIVFFFSTEESFCPAYFCYKSGADLRVGFQRDDFPFINVQIVPRPETRYERERLALLLRTLGIPQVKDRVSWPVSKAGAEEIRERYLVSRKPGERFVGLDISTCTGNRPTVKQLQSIAEVATALANTRTLVFFDSTKRKAANRIKATLGQKVLLFQTDDLPKTVALLEACHQLIACNTDLFHLAVAMGLPVTGIFSSSDIVRWVPADRKGVEVLEYETLKNWRPQQVSNTIQQRLLSTAPAKA